MEEWDWRKRLGYGAVQAVGLGLVAGAIELVAIVAGLQLPMIAVEVFLLGAVAVFVGGVAGGAFGLVAGLLVHPLFRAEESSRAIGRQLGVTAGLLAALHLVPRALALIAEGQAPAGYATAAMTIGFVGLVFYNARYWLRRLEIERPAPVGWLAVASGLSVAIIVAASALYAARPTGGTSAFLERKNVVFVTLDGVRHDDRVPALTAIGTEGIRFLDAVSPSPHTTPAAATVLTGLHPLRHHVIDDGDVLTRAYPTLPERLADAGYATAAFVGSRDVGAHTGLSQGFYVYDDDWMPLVGLDRIRLVGLLLDRTGVADRRPALDTTARFLGWLGENHERAFFAWVHLGGTTEEIDEALVKIRAALQHHEVLEHTLLVVVGTHGELRGEHGITGAVSLYDPAIRVPLVVRAPGVKMDTPLVEAQVRLMDLAATATEWLGIASDGETEGVGLLGYGRGQRHATMWVALVGRGSDGELRVGMRNNGVKYVLEPDGTERLYDLRADPAEQANLVDLQQATLQQARALMSSEIAAFEKLRGGR